MIEEKYEQQERSFELRSEKVRSIVGQIPSSLVRYGTAVIGLVLAVLLAVSYFLPYRKVYSGSAVIPDSTSDRPLHEAAGDSAEVYVFLKFDPNRLTHGKGLKLRLLSGDLEAKGTLLDLSAERDTLGRQEGTVRLALSDLSRLEGHTSDFRLTADDGTLLSHLLPF